jgi:hypothetical protein
MWPLDANLCKGKLSPLIGSIFLCHLELFDCSMTEVQHPCGKSDVLERLPS